MHKKSPNRNQEFQDKIARRSVSVRERAVAHAMRRKEEYLGARVPRELKDLVIKRAEELDIPVSILIRRVLEDAFGKVPAAKKVNVTAKVDESSQAGLSRDTVRYSGILGWEEISLNRPVNCSNCGTGLSSGMRVTLGIGTAGEEHVILCDLCKRSV